MTCHFSVPLKDGCVLRPQSEKVALHRRGSTRMSSERTASNPPKRSPFQLSTFTFPNFLPKRFPFKIQNPSSKIAAPSPLSSSPSARSKTWRIGGCTPRPPASASRCWSTDREARKSCQRRASLLPINNQQSTINNRQSPGDSCPLSEWSGATWTGAIRDVLRRRTAGGRDQVSCP
jgi:hypothetical protein